MRVNEGWTSCHSPRCDRNDARKMSGHHREAAGTELMRLPYDDTVSMSSIPGVEEPVYVIESLPGVEL